MNLGRKLIQSLNWALNLVSDSVSISFQLSLDKLLGKKEKKEKASSKQSVFQLGSVVLPDFTFARRILSPSSTVSWECWQVAAKTGAICGEQWKLTLTSDLAGPEKTSQVLRGTRCLQERHVSWGKEDDCRKRWQGAAGRQAEGARPTWTGPPPALPSASWGERATAFTTPHGLRCELRCALSPKPSQRFT